MREWLRRRAPAAPERTAAAQLRSALHFVLAGDLPAAEKALAEAARVDSSSSDVYLALANLYRLRGDIGRETFFPATKIGSVASPECDDCFQ